MLISSTAYSFIPLFPITRKGFNGVVDYPKNWTEINPFYMMIHKARELIRSIFKASLNTRTTVSSVVYMG